MNNYLLGVNMTNFFNREMFMYSLGDIKFKKPISLRKVAYATLFIILWTIPIFFIWGLKLDLVYLVFMFGPPLALAHFSTQPVFGGKTLVAFVKTMIKFIQEPKGWTCLNESKHYGDDVYYVESEIWVGRRRELQILADIKEQNFKDGIK